MIRILLALFLITSVCSYASDTLIFIIRVDDIQSRNTTMLPKNITYFADEVAKKGAKVTWAVIPHRLIENQNSDGKLSKDILTTVNKGHEVILHGFEHICPLCLSTGHEMYCSAQSLNISYSKQNQLIQDGLKIMKDTLGIIPKAFVPPGHYMDTTTFKALLDNGIKILSSSGVTKDYIYKNLFNLRQNKEFTWSLTSSNYDLQLKNAIADVMTAGVENGYYCLLYHDPFIREGYMNGIVAKWTNELIDSLSKRLDGKIKFMTLAAAAEHYNQGVNSINENLPDKSFILSQNYPNPFNPSTTIEFSTFKQEHVSLEVFNSIGQVVKTLVNKELPAGNYSINFESMDLSSGVYLYKLKTNSQQLTKKMMLLR